MPTLPCLLRSAGFALFVCLLALSTIAQNRAFVTNQSSNSITVIDLDNNAVLGSLSPFNQPSNIAMRTEGDLGIVTFALSGKATIFNPNDPLDFTNLDCGAGSNEVVISPDGKRAYVANIDAATVTIIDLDARNVVGTLSGGGYGVALSPDGAIVYSSERNNNRIKAWETATLNPLPSIDDVLVPQTLAMSPDGKYLAVAQSFASMVSLIDLGNATVTSFSTGSFPAGIAFTPDGKKLLAVNASSNTLSVIDVEQLQIASSLPIFGSPVDVAVLPNGSKAITANNADGTAAIIDLNSLTVQQYVTCGSLPSAVATTGQPSSTNVEARSRSSWSLGHPFPNPSEGAFSFSLRLPVATKVSIDLLDEEGKVRQSVFMGSLPAGEHDFRVDLTGLPARNYFLRVNDGVFSQAVPVVLGAR